MPPMKIDTITLRDADALVSHGLVMPDKRDAVAAVEARYAVAIPPALQALVGADAAAIAALIVALHGDGRAHGRAAKAGIALMRAAFSEAAVDAALGAAIEGRVV